MRNLRKAASLLLALVLTLGLYTPVLAAGPVDISETVGQRVYVDRSRINLPGRWVWGKNYIEIADGDVCMVIVRHPDKSLTECKCVKQDDVYRFELDLMSDDTVIIAQMGDINLNGEANSEDLALFARYTFNEYDFNIQPDIQNMIADVNRNGEANSEDLALFARYTFNEYDFAWNLTDHFGEIDPPDPVDPEPENTAPTVELSLSLSEDSQAGGYVGDILRQIYAEVSGSDAEDGEAVRLFLKLDDGIWFEAEAGRNTLGYAQSGEHTVYAYAEDSQGLKSEIIERTVVIEKISTLPVLVAEAVESTLGREFHVNIKVNDQAADSSVFEVWRTVWTLTNTRTGKIVLDGFTEPQDVSDGENSLVIGNVSKYGLDVAVTGSTGAYELTAVSIDQYGHEIWTGSVSLTVTNAKPGEAVDGLSYTVDRTDVAEAYTSGAMAKVHFEFDDTGVDPDGDAVTLYNYATNQLLEDGYYPVGNTTLTLYPVDEWGLMGTPFEYTVTVENTAPDAPVITVDRLADDTKWVDGKWSMKVNTDVQSQDAEGDAIQFVYESEAPSGYYATGDYLIRVKAVDALGGESDWTEQAFTVSNEPIKPPDGSFDVDTSFGLTANGEKEITIHAGTPVLLKTAVGKFEFHEVTYRQFRGGNETIAQDTVKFNSAALAAGQGMTLDWTPTQAGEYVYEVSVMANDTSIVTSELTRLTDRVVIHVTNTAPEAPVLYAQVHYDQVIVENGQMKYYVELTGTAYDADGDEATVIWDDAWVPGGYYAPGTYMVNGVYAVDAYGGRSPVNETYQFTVMSGGNPMVEGDEITVHQGDEFIVPVRGGKFAVQELVFQYADKSVRQTGSPVLSAGSLYEQRLSITDASGEYDVNVIAKVVTGSGVSEISAGTLRVTVYNNAPVVSVGKSVQGSYADGRMSMTVPFTAFDGDGDSFVTYCTVDGGVVVNLGGAAAGNAELKLTMGSHDLVMWTVDQWGAESERVSAVIHPGSYFTDNFREPAMSFEVTDEFRNGYTTDAKVRVDFDVEWNDALDMSQVDRIVYKVNGSEVNDLSGFYGLGMYQVEVYGIDIMGFESEHGFVTLELTNEAPRLDSMKFTPDRKDYVNEYTDKAAYKLNFTVGVYDPDGLDTVKLMRSVSGNVLEKNGDVLVQVGDTGFAEGDGTGYYSIGRHVARVKAVDIWGAESDLGIVDVEVTNKVPTLSEARFNDVTPADIVNAFTPDAAVNVTGRVSGSDADQDEYRFEYSVNGEVVDTLDGQYKFGDYSVVVTMRDVFNGVAENRFSVTLGGEMDKAVQLSHTVMDEWEMPYTEDARRFVNVNVGIPDGDDSKYTLYVSIDGWNYEQMPTCKTQTLERLFELGEHTIAAYAVDIWGNQTETVTDTFTFESEVPVVETRLTLRNEYFNEFTEDCLQGARVTASVTNDAGEPFKLVLTNVDGSKTEYTESVSLIEKLPLGESTVSARVTDVWGQSADSSASVTIEETMPTITLETKLVDNFRRPHTPECTQRVDITGTAVVMNNMPVKYELHWNGRTETYTSTTFYLSDFFGRGINGISANALTVWGHRGTPVRTSFVINNEKPTLSNVTAKIDLNDVQNPYTDNAKARVSFPDVTFNDDMMTGIYRPKVKYIIDGTEADMNEPLYLSRGEHTVEAYAYDVWAVESDHQIVTVNVQGDMPAVSLTSSTFADGDVVTDSSIARFTANVGGSTCYQLKYLDYNDANKKVGLLGKDLSAAAVDVTKVSWTSGPHCLVVQAKDKLGDAAYASFYFITGAKSSGSGSVAITSKKSELTTPTTMVDGRPAAYVSAFTVNVPAIEGHNSSNTDIMSVVGVAADGSKTTLVSFHTSDGTCVVNASGGNGMYHGSRDSGSFTYDSAKYVQLILTYEIVADGHEACVANAVGGLSYTINYKTLAMDDTVLSGLAELFDKN